MAKCQTQGMHKGVAVVSLIRPDLECLSLVSILFRTKSIQSHEDVNDPMVNRILTGPLS